MNEALDAYGNELQVGLCERDFSLPRSDVFPQVTRCNSAQSSGQQIRHTQLTNRSYFVITTPVFGVVILIRESFEPISGQTMSPLRMVFVEHNDQAQGYHVLNATKHQCKPIAQTRVINVGRFVAFSILDRKLITRTSRTSRKERTVLQCRFSHRQTFRSE